MQVVQVVQPVRTPAQMVVQVLLQEQASQLFLQLAAEAQVSPGVTVALVVVQQVDQQLVHQTQLEREPQDKVLTVAQVATVTVLVLLRNGVVAVAVVQVQLVARVHSMAQQVLAVSDAQFHGSQHQQHARFLLVKHQAASCTSLAVVAVEQTSVEPQVLVA